MNLGENRLEFIDGAIRRLEFLDVDVLKFFWDNEILFIRGVTPFLRPEFIKIFSGRQPFKVRIPNIIEFFYLHHKGHLFLGGLIGVNEQTIDLFHP